MRHTQDGIQIDIFHDDQNSFNIRVYAHEKDARGKKSFFNITKDGDIERQTIEDLGEMPKPLIVLPDHIFQALVQGMVNYSEEKNLIIRTENNLQGKLTATESHLTDMREIVKHILKMPKP